MTLPKGPGRRAALAAAGLFLLLAALVLPPVEAGDSGEYQLMAESLFRHGSPEARASDIRALGDLEVKFHGHLNFLDVARGYFESRRGERFSYHFWGYSLLTLPAKGLLHLLRSNELKAASLTNALFLLASLSACLQASGAAGRPWGLFVLSLFSPALFLLRWPHTEVSSFALVTLALLWGEQGRSSLAILASALAATQNPPLVVVVAVLMADGLSRSTGSWVGRLARVAVPALPALVPPLFFYMEFGTVSLVAREAASWKMVSLKKALELFLDPNLGLLPYLPVTLPLLGVGILGALFRKEAPLVLRNAALLAVLALLSTLTVNWNHGTSGPSRYTAWMLPLVFQGILPPGALRRPRLLGLAACSQALLVCLHGGPQARPDDLEHSFAARQVLRFAPRLYNPTPAIFVTRTLHRYGPPDGAVVYQASGACRKAYARPEDEEAVRSVCGAAGSPAEGTGFRYVDF